MFNHLCFDYLESLLQEKDTTSDKILSFFVKSEKPEKIYRYRQFNSFWKSNLFDGEIFLAPLNTLNDPYEGFFSIDSEREVKRVFYKEAIKEFDEVI